MENTKLLLLPLLLQTLTLSFLINAQNNIALKSFGQLPGCASGRISYTVNVDVHPNYKFSVFRIIEGMNADECAHLCHTHFFCRSVGFEPNDNLPTGGLCYMSYRKHSNCTNQSEKVTDFQPLNPVWIECDQCLGDNFRYVDTESRQLQPNEKTLVDA